MKRHLIYSIFILVNICFSQTDEPSIYKFSFSSGNPKYSEFLGSLFEEYTEKHNTSFYRVGILEYYSKHRKNLYFGFGASSYIHRMNQSSEYIKFIENELSFGGLLFTRFVRKRMYFKLSIGVSQSHLTNSDDVSNKSDIGMSYSAISGIRLKRITQLGITPFIEAQYRRVSYNTYGGINVLFFSAGVML